MQRILRLPKKSSPTCSIQLPNQDIIVGDSQGNLVRHKANGTQHIINRFPCAVRAVAVLSHSQQYALALENGNIQLRNFADSVEKEFGVYYVPDLLVALSNKLLLIKGRHNTFDVYDSSHSSRMLRLFEDAKFLAHIPDTDEFVFQDSPKSLLIMQMTNTGFVFKKAIFLSQEQGQNIQSLQMFSANACVVIKENQLVMWQLNAIDVTTLCQIKMDKQFIALHLIRSSAARSTTDLHAQCVTADGIQPMNLTRLFPGITKLLEQTKSTISDTERAAIRFQHHVVDLRQFPRQIVQTSGAKLVSSVTSHRAKL